MSSAGLQRSIRALAAIIGYSELIARRLDENDPILADVKLILAVAEQSASLTRQLLVFSRKERINPTVFDLNRLHVRLDQSLRCVRADRRQMEQIVTNLALNARDAMPDGGLLTVDTTELVVTDALARRYPDARCGAYARLTVTDTGAGMERAVLARIF